ncbi:MAG: hypothetical protein NTX29_02450 [Actinobacteria bacterium]|nr:hypothetical protein [Actinomycetota bacterium]
MKPFAKVFAAMFGSESFDKDSSRNRQIHREWDRQRSNAMSPSEREEIDAIFSRNL